MVRSFVKRDETKTLHTAIPVVEPLIVRESRSASTNDRRHKTERTSGEGRVKAEKKAISQVIVRPVEHIDKEKTIAVFIDVDNSNISSDNLTEFFYHISGRYKIIHGVVYGYDSALASKYGKIINQFNLQTRGKMRYKFGAAAFDSRPLFDALEFANKNKDILDNVFVWTYPTDLSQVFSQIIDLGISTSTIENAAFDLNPKYVSMTFKLFSQYNFEIKKSPATEKIVEKIIEVPVEKVVEKIIEVPVEKVVEVPVDRIIERVVEVPAVGGGSLKDKEEPPIESSIQQPEAEETKKVEIAPVEIAPEIENKTEEETAPDEEKKGQNFSFGSEMDLSEGENSTKQHQPSAEENRTFIEEMLKQYGLTDREGDLSGLSNDEYKNKLDELPKP
ncbi:MAG: hypothetical protein LBH47_00665 [Christensenellaceae bacterium]|jgi:hypothetical protein|nr:hypothetical protein [Christensenellaceae bacterium]